MPSKTITSKKDVYFAAVGDVHGHMHRMVERIKSAEQDANVSIAFVLQVGDFEPIRSADDLMSVYGPVKYRVLGDYHDFHCGKTCFPWPVYFIGGNHEPYSYLDTITKGGELSNNCHYIGRTGCEIICGMRVVGLSGVYNPILHKDHRPDVKHILSVKRKLFGYFNQHDIDVASSYSRADILMVHDWPQQIGHPELMPTKAKMRNSLGSFGNEYVNYLVAKLRPRLVLCGHMHCAHNARIEHPDNTYSVVHCMADVRFGDTAVKLFQVKSTGQWSWRHNQSHQVQTDLGLVDLPSCSNGQSFWQIM